MCFGRSAKDAIIFCGQKGILSNPCVEGELLRATNWLHWRPCWRTTFKPFRKTLVGLKWQLGAASTLPEPQWLFWSYLWWGYIWASNRTWLRFGYGRGFRWCLARVWGMFANKIYICFWLCFLDKFQKFAILMAFNLNLMFFFLLMVIMLSFCYEIVDVFRWHAHGLIWSIFEYVRIYVNFYNVFMYEIKCAWLNMYNCLSMFIFEYVIYIWMYLRLFEHVWICLSIFAYVTLVWMCLIIFECVWICNTCCNMYSCINVFG